MVTKRNSRKSGTIGLAVLGKPNGVIQPRVQAVGPERFGIVAVDCAKARSKWMLRDFYGKVLIPPTVVEHQRAALQIATCQLKEACQKHGLLDHIVAVEMTCVYHRPVQRAFRKAGSETRLMQSAIGLWYFTEGRKLPAAQAARRRFGEWDTEWSLAHMLRILPRLLTRFRATAYAIGWLVVSPAKVENRQLQRFLLPVSCCSRIR